MWDAPWYWGYWSYYNPYCTDVVVVERTVIDYSRPIVLAAPPPAPTGTLQAADLTRAENEALQLLDASREAFVRADYPAAMTLIDQAVARKPNDAVLHEVRALVLFAMGQYKPAAAAVYAVLSVGPGWDWPTLNGFYASPAVYEGQLRALEQYRHQHPDLPEIHFLLAYHYMSCGHAEAASAEFRAAESLNHEDHLSAQLLAGLTSNTPEINPTTSQPAVPSQSVTVESLLGSWDANRADGASFASLIWPMTQHSVGSTHKTASRNSNSAAPTRWPTTSSY